MITIILLVLATSSSLKIQEITVPVQRTDVISSTDSVHVWKRHFVELVQDTAVQGRRRRRRRTTGKPKITGVVLTSDQTSFQDSITMKVVYTFDKSAIFGTATGTPYALVHTSVVDGFGAIPLPYARNSNGAEGSTTARQTFEQTFRANSFTYTHSVATTDSFSLGGNSLILNGATTDADVTHLSTLGTTTVTITHGHCQHQDGFTANTLFPCFCGETVCQSDKTFCEYGQLLDPLDPTPAADRLCTTVPVCEHTTGLLTSERADRANCYCGTSTCGVSTSAITGHFCTKATNFCAPIKTCADQTRRFSNDVTAAGGDCRCGSTSSPNTCSNSGENYCDGSNCQGFPLCQYENQQYANDMMTLDCLCGGTDTCSGSTQSYCSSEYADNEKCRQYSQCPDQTRSYSNDVLMTGGCECGVTQGSNGDLCTSSNEQFCTAEKRCKETAGCTDQTNSAYNGANMVPCGCGSTAECTGTDVYCDGVANTGHGACSAVPVCEGWELYSYYYSTVSPCLCDGGTVSCSLPICDSGTCRDVFMS